MSSYIISKENYLRAAGLIATMIETNSYYREPALLMWNNRKQRRYTADDVQADFTRLYEINVESFNAQYDDHQEPESGDLGQTFTAAKLAGKDLMQRGYTFDGIRDRRTLQLTIFELVSFFSSIQYQIEGKEFTRRALRILNKYYRGIYSVLQIASGFTSEDVTSWGDFNFPDTDTNENLQGGM